MWDNSGAQEDLYCVNRDQRMLPTTDQHLAQVGNELSGDVLKNKQVCRLRPSWLCSQLTALKTGALGRLPILFV